MRNGKKIATVDVYDFILKGKTMDATRLQEGDVIIVPPYEMLVDIQGNVKRPMYYEMKEGETIQTLIDYAGDFTADAYSKNLRITRTSHGAAHIDGDPARMPSVIDVRCHPAQLRLFAATKETRFRPIITPMSLYIRDFFLNAGHLIGIGS